MQTALADFVRDTAHGKEADAILRTCVHCGFCTATCPTYQLLGDELDGPRGRIYLIKQVLEGRSATAKTQLHLDRCLTCRSCETTCPSGVKYGRLVEIGRELVDDRVPRSLPARVLRRLLRLVLPFPRRFGPLLRLGQWMRPLLPPPLKRKVPPPQRQHPWPEARHERKMIVLEGCVQPAIAPNINTATSKVLQKLGIDLVRVPETGCCGAVSYHLSAQEEGLNFMRRNIDAWWPHMESGAEAILPTASACAAMVKEYGELLKDDTAYADRAAKVSALTKDISEAIQVDQLAAITRSAAKRGTVAFHSPCTLQHGQKILGVVESLLQQAGYELTSVQDAHLCCGSAGTYSILQPALSKQLLEKKLAVLQSSKPDVIATANIGCLAHLRTEAVAPVKHWIELIEPTLQ